MSDAIENFVDELRKTLSSNSFVKLTLSNYKGADEHLQKILIRLIETKQGLHLAFQYHYRSRQTVRNFVVEKGVGIVNDALSSGFRSAHLFTTTNDLQLTIGKKSARLVRAKPTFTELPSRSHDRQKTTLIDKRAYFLKALGVTTDQGEVRSQQHDKWRQINKYVEIIRDQFERSALRERSSIRIVDMGSGKGYLTFAAYDYFANVRGLTVDMIGIESRDELVTLCNDVATAAGFDGLKFVESSIADFEVGEVDILIALHACDTATDDALFKGISARAEIILAAPCCHKELRPQLRPPDVLKDILKYGIMQERTAETVTDGVRALLLEENGYRTNVFEFVAAGHTPKNNMIAAIRRASNEVAHDKSPAESVLEAFGIDHQRLHRLLTGNDRIAP